jgi:hypothetical protein
MRFSTTAGFVTVCFSIPMMALGQDGAAKNEVLLEATSPFEDIAEFALEKEFGEIRRQIALAEKQAAEVKKALSPDSQRKFSERLSALKKGTEDQAHLQVADHSVEMFRLLIDNLDAAHLEVPKEVSLLDYAGFKIHVLTAAESQDWSSIKRTADEAQGWWAAIRLKVKHPKLRDAMDTAVRGLGESAAARNLAMVNFAAQVDLDLVDLLEAEFEK